MELRMYIERFVTTARARLRQDRSSTRRAPTSDVPRKCIMTSAALDVADLPEYGFGDRSIMWWATASMMVIEGNF